MALNPGHTLLNGHYQIVRLLGRGGFGFVYEARDTLLNERVAIKELIPALVGDEAMLKRFLAEARATLRLRHERIVGTHNVFSEGGNYYIVMECMAGGSLEARLREQGHLKVEEAVQVAAEVCEGLAYAHRRGVVHCDLKPANILFDEVGCAKVADFGIAHVSGEMLTRSWMTPAGFVAGTLPYMSPEQADGVRDDPRIDVYAVGAVLYRLLTGQPYLAFDERETPGAQADNVLRIRGQEPAPPSAQAPGVPAWLDGVVLRALDKQPEARYDHAEALRAALLHRQALATALPATPLVAEPRASPPPPHRVQDTPSRPAAPAASAARAASAAARPSPLPAWFWPATGAAAVLLALLIVAIAALGRGGDGREVAGATQTRAQDGMVMVYVPAGDFLMGSAAGDSDADGDEKPQHTVYLDAFWIDKTEVTNAQFRQCVEAGACHAPTTCEWGGPTYGDAGKADHPVVCVSWSQAQAYCEWTGARLPTEAEWEKAARGVDGRKYPWGDSDPDCKKAQYSECGQTVQVGSKLAGDSPYGALDMAGNVWEWVADWYDKGYYNISSTNNPKGPNSGDYMVLRGGSWYRGWRYVRAADRNHFYPTLRNSDIGFRCGSASAPGE